MQLFMLCSLDSFLAAAGMILMGCPSRYRQRLVLSFSFVAFDVLAAMAGASLHRGISPAMIGLALGAAAIIVGSANQTPVAYLLIPALFGLDNFALGALGGDPTLELHVLLAGLSSGLFAWAGFLLGGRLSRGLTPTTAWLSGVAALSVALLA